MTNTQHTKGLWFYSDDMQGADGKAQIGVREANGLPVAFLGSYKEAKANARLIAAAPELLENSEEQTVLIHDVLQALYSAPEFKGRKNLVERLQKSLGVSQDLNAKARGQA